MHFLLTGGCGFIGSHLADRLAAQGHRLTIIDDLSTGTREYLPRHATLLVGDITTPGVFDAILSQVDGVFHLAAIASVQRSLTEWHRTQVVNVGGTVQLLEAIHRSGCKVPVVFASSAAVYGDAGQTAVSEEVPTRPLSNYGVDKRSSEEHLRMAWKLHGIPTLSLRFFNVYGTRQRADSPYSGVISRFCSQLAQHIPLSIHGDGEQSRDFIHVDDIVLMLQESMRQLSGGMHQGEVLNACTGHATSINRLIEVLGRRLNVTPQLQHAPARSGDIRFSLGDPVRLRELLGITAQIKLEEGLATLT